MMCGKKKCAPIYMAHPIFYGMLAAFAAVGVFGVFMAVKSKANRLGKAARRLSCECIENVKETAEDWMEDGMEAMERMMHKGCDCQ